MKKIISIVLVMLTIATCFAGCSMFGELSTAHEPILILEKVMTTKDQPEADLCTSNKWVVYYDGVVEYEETYRYSGVKNKKSWTLMRTQIEEINDILLSKTKKQDDTGIKEEKMYWTFTYMKDNGEVISEYSIDYKGDRSLVKIVEMLN